MGKDIIKNQYQEFSEEIRSIGSWSFNQNLLYVIFLQRNKLVMISKKKIRNLRVFDQMADLITSRNSLQCRSHHQKLLQKFGEVKVIISNFKKYVNKEEYKNKFQEIYGEDKTKEQSNPKVDLVKQQELSQEADQFIIKVQDNAPAVIEYKVDQADKFYYEYLSQMSLQLGQYSLMNFYYPGQQIFP